MESDPESHKSMPDSTQRAIVNILEKAIPLYIFKCLHIPEVQDLILSRWYERYSVDDLPVSVAKLAFDYNSSRRGHNQKIQERVNHYLRLAWKARRNDDRKEVSALILQSQLHPRIFFEQDIIEAVSKSSSKGARILQKGISRRRERLVTGANKIIASIASQAVKNLSGDIVSLSDITQQGLMSAYDATLTYKYTDPRRASKWTDYAYSKIFHSIRKYVAEQTRTVALPRSTLDRWGPVQEAIQRLGRVDYDAVAQLANRINAKRKHSSSGRKLSKREIYTPKEVEYLILAVKNTQISLNFPHKHGRERTVGDIIPDSTVPLQTKIIEKDKVKRNLLNKLSRILTPTEVTVLYLRWGLDQIEEPRSQEYVSTHLRINKLKVKQIEREALEKLKKNSNDFIELKEAMESYIG